MSNQPDHNACPFCRIIAGQLPASVVHREEHWLVLMDIHPLRPGHVLIIPRQHAGHLHQFDPARQQRLFVLADAVLRAQQQVDPTVAGANLLLNDGSAANQHIPHLHLHCIPRRHRDSLGFALGLLSRTAGIFGIARKRSRLDAQAEHLRQVLAQLPALGQATSQHR